MATVSAYYPGPKEIHYLFVDGGALRGRLKNLSDRHFGGVTFDINFQALAAPFTKVFYYDALRLKNPGESDSDYEERIRPESAILDSATATDGIHVYTGDVRQRRRRGAEQKKVDVKLTVDMLMHAVRRNMHRATLLTGDVDFKPLIDALVQEGMFITLWYPPEETNPELIHAADSRTPLNMRALDSLLTPASRKIFQIPRAQNEPPSEQSFRTAPKWTDIQEGSPLALYFEDSEFVVTKDINELNRFTIRHTNYELLEHYCAESEGIHIPATPPG